VKDPERRHTWPQRFLIVFNAGLIVASLSAASAFGYFYVQFGRLPHVSISPGKLTHTQSSSDPQNFLLVGSDSREFVDDTADAKSFGKNTGPPRADTIMLVRVDPRAHHAWVLSLPRDLLVPISPTGRLDRINTAYSGGADELIQTIKDDFQVPINHYAEVNFKGLQQVVDAVGGVKVFLPSPVRDYDTTVSPPRNETGLLILDTGCVLLHGNQALAYVRSRHFQYRENGRWVSQPGDLERNTRQQDFVRRTLRVVLSKGLLNLTRLNRLANAAHGNLKLSNSLNLSELVKLGRNFHSLAPDSMTQYALPVTPRSYRGASILKVLDKDQAAAEQILAVFRGTPQSTPSTPVLQPSTVNVRVLNGSGQAGQAGDASAALQKNGFATSTPGTTSRTTQTVIRYGPGQEAKAALLARYLGTDAVLQSRPSLTGVDLELVTGSDFTTVLSAPRVSAPVVTTTTTAVPPVTAPATPDC